MITRPRPHAWQLLYILRGSVIPAIAPRLLLIFLLALAVSAFAELIHPPGIERISVAPFTLFGLVLSIFLSFRNNACHERWWEGRKQWGQLIVESRSLARHCHALLPGNRLLQERVLRLSIGFAHALAARLRESDTRQAASPWLEEGEREALLDAGNVPDRLLERMARLLAEPLHQGRLDPYLYGIFEQRLASMSVVQAACERIHATPLPFAYSLLLHRCAWLFCILLPFGLVGSLGWATPLVSLLLAYAFFGLDQLGEEMEDPFGFEPNDLPLDALAGIIESELLAGLDPPAPAAPSQPRDHAPG